MSELKTKLKEAFTKGGSEYVERVILTILDAGFDGYETRDKVVQYLQHEYDRYNRLPDKTFLYALALQMKELKTGKKKMFQVDSELARQFGMSTRRIQYYRSKVGAIKRKRSSRKSIEVETPEPIEEKSVKPEPEEKPVKPTEHKVILHIELTIPSEILDLLKGGK